MEPLPVEAKLYLPGWRRKASSHALTESTPIAGVTAHTFGLRAASVTGVKSLNGSYGRFLYRMVL